MSNWTILDLDNSVISFVMNDIKTFLQDELLDRCRKNPNYSLRSFARFFGNRGFGAF